MTSVYLTSGKPVDCGLRCGVCQLRLTSAKRTLAVWRGTGRIAAVVFVHQGPCLDAWLKKETGSFCSMNTRDYFCRVAGSLSIDLPQDKWLAAVK